MKPRFGSGSDVDFRLSRKQVIEAYRAGHMTRDEVCDAQPELRRAAVHTGKPISGDCPICEERSLVVVMYVFGPRLPKHGRCITAEGEVRQLARRKGEFTCYEVEVCAECGWNHMLRVRILGSAAASVRREESR